MRSMLPALALLLAAAPAAAQTDAQLRYVCKQFIERQLHDPGSAAPDNFQLVNLRVQ